MAIILPRNELAYQNAQMGTGIGRGLENLAQGKMQQLQQQQQQRMLANSLQPFGLSHLAGLPEPLIKEAFKEHLLRYGVGPNREGQQSGGESGQEGNLGAGVGQRRLSAHDILAEKRHKEDQALKQKLHQENIALKKESLAQKTKVQSPKAEAQTKALLAPYESDIKLISRAEEALDILKSKKVKTGLRGRLPTELLSKEEADLDTIFADLVNAKAGSSPLGRTVAGLEAIERSKPNRKLPLATIENLLNKDIKDAKARLKHGEKNAQIGKRVKSLLKDQPISSKQQQPSFNELPSAQQYAGKKIQDTQTGQWLMSNGQSWVPSEGM